MHNTIKSTRRRFDHDHAHRTTNYQKKADLDAAFKRLDTIIDAPDGSLEADERSALSDLIAAYEDRHPVIPRGGPLGIVRRIMATHKLTQRTLPEIGAQSVASAVLQGKRPINARMASALAKRFHLPIGAFIE